MSVETNKSTEALQRTIAEQTAAAREAQAELDRRAAAAQAAAKAEEDAAASALLADRVRVQEALQQAGNDAYQELAAGVDAGDLTRAFAGYIGWHGARQARRYHRDDVSNAATRLGKTDPYPNELRHVNTTFSQWVEERVGTATNRSALRYLAQLGLDH